MKSTPPQVSWKRKQSRGAEAKRGLHLSGDILVFECEILQYVLLLVETTCQKET